jgi:hypothetical protein
MRTINQQGVTQFQDIPSFPDQLEVIVSNIECRLLETLTPDQFAMVQHLIEATQLLTELESTVGTDMYSERMSA